MVVNVRDSFGQQQYVSTFISPGSGVRAARSRMLLNVCVPDGSRSSCTVPIAATPGVHRAGKGTLDQGCLLDLVGVDGLKRPVLLALAHVNEESSENCVAFFEFIKSVHDPVPMVA